MVKFLLAFFATTLLTTHLFATITIQSSEDAVSMKRGDLSYYIDPNGSSNVSVINALLSKFKPSDKDIVNLGFEKSDVWFTFDVKNTSNERLVRYLHLNNPIIDEVDVYQLIGKSTWVLIAKGGDQRPFEWRENGYRQLIFPIQLEGNATSTFLFRVSNGGEQFYFKSTLEKRSHIEQKLSQNQVFYGVLFGVMFFIILLNLFIGVLFKQRIAYYYTLYAFSFTGLQLSLLGFGTTWLWTDQYFISNRANPFFATLGVLFFLLFTYRFLSLYKFMPNFSKWIMRLKYLLFLNLILSVIPGVEFMHISAILVNVLTLGLNIVIIYPLVYILRQGYRPAKAYLIAFSILQLSVFAFVLRNFGLIPDSFIAENGLQLGSAAEMLILTFGILQRFKLMNDESLAALAQTNQLKEELNIQLEHEVNERTKEVIEQRNLLARKNNEITSSIQYAKRIQNAILPSRTSYEEKLPGLHVWYQPKDIVAGDFYWVKRIKIDNIEWYYFAVADCTGHGVPGAMLSVLCMNALHETSRLVSKPSTEELLDAVNAYLNEYLLSEGFHLSDGMDISVGLLQPETLELKWSGANNPLWILTKNGLVETKGTKRPIGKSDSKLPFTEHQFQLEKGDRIVLFSDGCVDQFGGPQGKKFKTSGFRNLISETKHLDSKAQINQVEKGITSWMSKEEQIDDICVMLIDV